jgi:hypothetical protein
MGRQVQTETVPWYTQRQLLRHQILTAVTTASYDFEFCQTVQYTDLPQGAYGAPVTVAMEAVLIAGYASPASTLLTNDDQISIMQQVNTLESFRRCYLSQRQTRRDFLAHLTQQLQQEDVYDNQMLQQFAGTDKVLATTRAPS